MPTTKEPEHFTFKPEQDLGTLLMILLQVHLTSPDLRAGLKFGSAGQLGDARFCKDEAGKPKLDALELETEAGLFLIVVVKKTH